MERARYHMNRETNSEADESMEYDDANILLPWDNREKSGFTYSSRINYAGFTSVGDMREICNFCHALKWRKETDGMCCSNGKIVLPNFQDPPHLLKSLLNGDHPQSKHFLDNIHLYNCVFQMTSFGAKQITEGPFMPTFKVQGQVYHLIGSLLPENEPKFILYPITRNSLMLEITIFPSSMLSFWLNFKNCCITLTSTFVNSKLHWSQFHKAAMISKLL